MRKLLILSIVTISFLSCGPDKPEYASFPMWDPELPMETRVKDLVSRLTLEEKVGQMLNAAPAIERLGIPAYDWWNEVLHGVARTPFKVTVYPQAIAMAATWDTSSLRKMAHYSALEGRAIHNEAIKSGRTNERYLGLTYWTPNINIFRDPRWGRGQETYGEDPFLTGTLGKSFVRGLQGDDEKYLKAAACAKHFAVHSGPEPTRHSFNAEASAYDLWDTYLPAFKELVVNADVAGVMCAYNAFRSEPCCANGFLMNEILREQWNFTGYVTSDCWAIDDFFRYHKTHPGPMESAADAVLHGTDVECGTSVYKTLLDAVKKGLLKEEQLDVSLIRLFTIRFRLGMFDPPSMVPFAELDKSVLEADAHKEHSLKMARQSMVLLRNEEKTLPLQKSIKKIAVIGPNANNRISVLGNYNGSPSSITTVVDGLKKKLGASTEVYYEKAVNFTNDTLMVYTKISGLFSFEGKKGVKAEYFKNETLSGKPDYTTTVPDIDFYWGEGETPGGNIGTIHYSGRFTTTLKASSTETMNFEAEGDDGYKVFINDSLYIDAWERNRWGSKPFKLAVEAGKEYRIVVEFHQSEGNAAIRLKAGDYVKTNMNELVNRVKDADVILFAGGISPQLEGEEMPVNFPGFDGGDRTSIMLPAVQTECMKALKNSGKPVVFVMMTGSAIATPWESRNIPAILNAWYAGQSAGDAVADILFGDYNPSGRLPVTFYAKDSDLKDFNSYSMDGRTYRYFSGKPLYPFGYGLSYSTFEYSDLKTSFDNKGNMVLEAALTNKGAAAGEEVAQLYLRFPSAKTKAPLLALKGFQRMVLKPGETKQVRFVLAPNQWQLVDEKGGAVAPGEMVRVSIGGGQPGTEIVATSNVVEGNIRLQ